jgi:predicted HTH transcriptional regulator
MSNTACPFSPAFTITNRIAAALTRIERARGFLDAATLSEDWLKTMSGLAIQLSEVQERGRRTILHDILVKQHALSARQSKALFLAEENAAFTIQDLETACPNVNRRTLQRDLKILIDKGLLSAEGATKGTIYHRSK